MGTPKKRSIKELVDSYACTDVGIKKLEDRKKKLRSQIEERLKDVLVEDVQVTVKGHTHALEISRHVMATVLDTEKLWKDLTLDQIKVTAKFQVEPLKVVLKGKFEDYSSQVKASRRFHAVITNNTKEK